MIFARIDRENGKRKKNSLRLEDENRDVYTVREQQRGGGRNSPSGKRVYNKEI